LNGLKILEKIQYSMIILSIHHVYNIYTGLLQVYINV